MTTRNTVSIRVPNLDTAIGEPSRRGRCNVRHHGAEKTPHIVFILRHEFRGYLLLVGVLCCQGTPDEMVVTERLVVIQS